MKYYEVFYYIILENLCIKSPSKPSVHRALNFQRHYVSAGLADWLQACLAQQVQTESGCPTLQLQRLPTPSSTKECTAFPACIVLGFLDSWRNG